MHYLKARFSEGKVGSSKDLKIREPQCLFDAQQGPTTPKCWVCARARAPGLVWHRSVQETKHAPPLLGHKKFNVDKYMLTKLLKRWKYRHFE